MKKEKELSPKELGLAVKTERLIDYKFTPQELAEKAQELARQTIEKTQLLKDKKQITDEFKAKESALDAAITLSSQKVQNRGEMRRMEVFVMKDFDGGMKSSYDVKTGVEIMRERMVSDDYQLEVAGELFSVTGGSGTDADPFVFKVKD